MVYSNLEKLNLSSYKFKLIHLDLKEIIKKINQNPESKIKLRYTTRDNKLKITYTPVHHGFLPTPIYIPRSVPLDEKTLEIFGLFQGEGYKKSRGDIQFSNTNPDLIEFFLDYFKEYWDINKKDWRAIIEYRKPNLTKPKESYLLNFWNKFGPLKNIRIIHRKKLLSDIASENGSLMIRFHNTALYLIIMGLLNQIKKSSERNPSYAGPYLRGLLASDGYTKLREDKISKINIVTSDKKTAIHYNRVFDVLKIRSNIETAHSIIITTKKSELNKYRNIIRKKGLIPTEKRLKQDEIILSIYNKNDKVLGNIYTHITNLNDNTKILRKYKYDIASYGWNNFFRILFLLEKPFGSNTKRNKIFFRGLLNHKRTEMIKRFENLPKIFKTQDYQNQSKVSQDTAYVALRFYLKKGILIKNNKKKLNHYKLSKKGKTIINTLNKINN